MDEGPRQEKLGRVPGLAPTRGPWPRWISAAHQVDLVVLSDADGATTAFAPGHIPAPRESMPEGAVALGSAFMGSAYLPL